jgi:hypothetical protein
VQENGGFTKTFRLSIDNKLLDCSLHLSIREFIFITQYYPHNLWLVIIDNIQGVITNSHTGGFQFFHFIINQTSINNLWLVLSIQSGINHFVLVGDDMILFLFPSFTVRTVGKP